MIGELAKSLAEQWGIALDGRAAERLEKFSSMLVEKNKVMNLTAITEPEKIARLHFADCLYLLKCAVFSGKKTVDVGCGGGFPVIPLLCAMPQADITGIDSTAKRVAFVEECALALGIGGSFVAARAEEYAQKHRESFDIAVSRAVAPLNILAELCLPLVRTGGVLLAMKSLNDDELSAARHAITVLGGRLSDISVYSVGDEYPERRIIRIEKIKPCPPQYPRRYAKIASTPL